jgi:hypothetical protein
MKKQAAISPQVLKGIIGALGGAAAGGLTGYEVTPRLGGYEDVESARRSAALMHGLTGAVLGGIAGGQGIPGLKALGAGKAPLAAGAALLAEEALPMGLATMKRQQEASKAQTEAALTGGIPYNVQKALSSPTAAGAGIGAAGAGLTALLTGLMRRKSDAELQKRKTRGQMITSDFLKYLVPAALAGGVVGSLRKDQ